MLLLAISLHHECLVLVEGDEVKTYFIKDENDIPQELLDAVAQGKTIQVNTETVVGWVDVDPEFRCGVELRVKPERAK